MVDLSEPQHQVEMAQILWAAAGCVVQMLEGQRLSLSIASVSERQNFTGRSRAALQDMSFEATRRLGWARVVAGLLNRQPASQPLAALQWVALTQLRANSRRHPAVIVNEAVSAARRHLANPGQAAFLNATLRRYLRDEAKFNQQALLAAEANLNQPAWWSAQLKHDWPLEFEQLHNAGSQAAPLTLRVNVRRAERARLIEQLQAAEWDARPIGSAGIQLPRSVDVTRLPGYAQGAFSVQDYGAQLAAPLLDVSDGHRVLDACAAPGGKTAHLLEICTPSELLALDIDQGRMNRVRDNLGRLGLNANCRVANAASPDSWWDGRCFDRILLDAPCSASGIVRRHPDIPWLRKRGEIATLAAQQYRLLKALWPLLEPGGKLLFVTCSVFRAEGQQVVDGFLRETPGGTSLTLNRNLIDSMNSPTSGSKPGTGVQLLPTVSPWVRQAHSQSAASLSDHDGFYYALLGKQG